MSELSQQVKVMVEPFYLDGDSSMTENRFVFGYTVTIRNDSEQAIQLLARYWKITPGNGQVQEVRGEGVVGEQPLIAAGEHFRYTSRAVLDCAVGVMEGTYTCIDNATQTTFEVPIKPFRLASPLHVH
ncbi:Co2+/Mg2+ efflux protein ApaG [Phytohalomonas tamaricis]|uniref:Co2+/Mg2+ efflux protein ApaG n=1 Tax=Phytohalomonas tamaricis TaxID=2081032 RepID=UPI000D0B6648|nr:Co2+/Mg2+ efflux protein ApaG [Phytohalomonas tamaricis]